MRSRASEWFLLLCAAVLPLSGKGPAPALEEAVAPAYPAAAATGKISGTVLVIVQVDRSGKVTGASIAEGHAFLRQASLDAARLWRFQTRRQASEVKLTFSFKLMPKNTPEPELGAVFKPPYTVEVRKIPAQPVTHYARGTSNFARQALR